MVASPGSISSDFFAGLFYQDRPELVRHLVQAMIELHHTLLHVLLALPEDVHRAAYIDNRFLQCRHFRLGSRFLLCQCCLVRIDRDLECRHLVEGFLHL